MKQDNKVVLCKSSNSSMPIPINGFIGIKVLPFFSNINTNGLRVIYYHSSNAGSEMSFSIINQTEQEISVHDSNDNIFEFVNGISQPDYFYFFIDEKKIAEGEEISITYQLY